MNQNNINEVMSAALNYYCADNWSKIIEYYGEETANELDFIENFSYDEIYERGDLKECEAYFNIAVIQRFLVSSLFDIGTNEEAMTTFVTLEYYACKLFDKYTGEQKHLWIQ